MSPASSLSQASSGFSPASTLSPRLSGFSTNSSQSEITDDGMDWEDDLDDNTLLFAAQEAEDDLTDLDLLNATAEAEDSITVVGPTPPPEPKPKKSKARKKIVLNNQSDEENIEVDNDIWKLKEDEEWQPKVQRQRSKGSDGSQGDITNAGEPRRRSGRQRKSKEADPDFVYE